MRILPFLLLMAASALAQYNESIDVHVVEVPVTVVDHAGNPVRGLKAENFEILDDGVNRRVTAFEAIDFATAAPSAISPLNPNARRTFMIVFDLGFSQPKEMERSREAARKFITESVKPRDLVSVATLDPEKGFHLVCSFTTDRDLLVAAVAAPTTFRGLDPLQLSNDTDVLSAGGESAIPETGKGAEAAATRAEIAERATRQLKEGVRGRINRQVDALGDLARVLRSVPGTKQVVLLTSGFDPSLVRGRDAGSMKETMADFDKITSGSAYQTNSDERYGSSSNLGLIDRMAKQFRESDVVLHAIDIAGIRLAGSSDSLHLLSDPTGGTVFKNVNSLGEDFDRMLHQQEVVYVLAFQAPQRSDGKFHRLTVRLNGVRGDVHHRSGYFDGGKMTPAERAFSTAEIIVNDIAQNDIHLSALAAPMPAAGRSVVPLVLEIPRADLFRDASGPVAAEFFVYAFDHDGIVRDRVHEVLAADPAKADGRRGLKYVTTLALPPGNFAIKSLVRLPKSDKRGFVRTDVVVPAADEVALLPPLFFDDAADWTIVKGAQHAEPYPLSINGDVFVPATAALLREGTPRDFALFLYNADPETMMLQTSVTPAGKAPHPANVSLLRQVRGDAVTKLVFRYEPEAGLAGGTLELRIHAKDSADAHTASVPLTTE